MKLAFTGWPKGITLALVDDDDDDVLRRLRAHTTLVCEKQIVYAYVLSAALTQVKRVASHEEKARWNIRLARKSRTGTNGLHHYHYKQSSSGNKVFT